MKPYRSIPIEECGEPLVPIPKDRLAFFEPHPYQALGAPYGNASPWMLRKSVLESLLRAQNQLEQQRPGWKIKLFDAYRPNAVQIFMVEREYKLVAQKAGLDPDILTPAEREELAPRVYRVFAKPSDDPATPPPHSTGAVIDCTLCDEKGNDIDMGSPIDENSDRSNADFFENAPDPKSKAAHRRRLFLKEILEAGGFRRLKTEWWHFSLGDQHWVFREREVTGDPTIIARYGRI